jgi:hypothetical protein
MNRERQLSFDVGEPFELAVNSTMTRLDSLMAATMRAAKASPASTLRGANHVENDASRKAPSSSWAASRSFDE